MTLTQKPVKPQADDAIERCHAWYRAFGRAVYRLVRFQVDSADTADDITGDVFLRVLEAGTTYDPAKGDAGPWVFSIARNAVRDHFRRLKVRRHVNLNALRDVAVDAPSPEERLMRQEQIGRLLLGVQHLKEPDRDLIGLRYGSELSTAEIAQMVGVPEGAVRTRLSRALARLRSALAGEHA